MEKVSENLTQMSWAWWCTSMIPVGRRWRWEDPGSRLALGESVRSYVRNSRRWRHDSSGRELA
jgi:hypothetical protein